MTKPTWRVTISGVASLELAEAIAAKFPPEHDGEQTGLRVVVSSESTRPTVLRNSSPA